MAQQVTIVGTMTDAEGKSTQVTINGIGQLLVDPGYGIPAPPPTATPPIYYPPVFPAHPIVPPPGGVVAPPIYYPPEIWPPPVHPAHPIVLPEPPEVPTEPPIAPPGGGISEGWQWYYSPVYGWILVWKPPGGGGKPQPPAGDVPVATPHK
jgi:hypothetical protein